MFAALRRRITYANVAMTLALVFAMAGGALAASGKHHKKHNNRVVITSTKQIGKSVLTALKGNVGQAGPQGPAGLAGPQGPAGKDGSNGLDGEQGEKGEKGAKGDPGATGSSAVVSNTAPNCAAGGVTVEVEGSGEPQEVCNGEKGEEGKAGKEGEPWTAGGTLPSGSTETGSWAFSGAATEGSEINPSAGVFKLGYVGAAVSFPISLAAPIAESHTQINPVGFPVASGPNASTTEEKEHCPGSVGSPKAKSGYFCVYTGFVEHTLLLNPELKKPFAVDKASEPSFGGVAGTDTAGATVIVLAGEEEPSHPEGAGTWAVTG